MSKNWMITWIAFYVCGMITYLVVVHTGTEDGQIKPDIVYTAFISIFATKIVDFIIKAAVKKKDVKNGKG